MLLLINFILSYIIIIHADINVTNFLHSNFRSVEWRARGGVNDMLSACKNLTIYTDSMGPNLSMSIKTSIYFTKKTPIRCINKLYYNAHTEPLFIPNKILKLDDLYTFELSKFMFDCINGLLPTPILEHFTTNATIHAHHTRQRHIPQVTETFGTISERSVTHKGPKTWTEIPQTKNCSVIEMYS